ncbi:MAG: MFS transporter [Blastocatellales bacterium]
MTSSSENSDSRWTRYRLGNQFWIFLAASCLFNLGMFMYVLLYNLYLLDLGYKEDFLGWVSSAMTAGNILGAVAAVTFNRRIGLKASVLVFFVSMPVISTMRALVTDRLTLLGFAFLAGTFFSIWAISFAVVIAQVTTAEQRPIGFSVYLATVIGVGVIADPVGGHLPKWLTALFNLTGEAQAKQFALLLACCVVSLAIWPAARMRLARMTDGARVSYPRNQFIFRFLIAVAVLNVATAAFNPFANAFFSKHLRMPADQIGLVFSGGQFAQVVAILISPLILKRFGLVWGVASMEFAAGISLLFLATGPPAMMAASGYAGYLAFQWMDEPAMESLLMTRVQPHERSGAAAMMYMTIFAAGAVTAPLAGKGITHFGYSAVMTVAAILLLVGGMLFGLLLKKYEREAELPSAELTTNSATAD